MLFTKLLLLGGASAAYSAALPASNATCKANPVDFTWPKESEWLSLNKSIGGLIASSPVAASCWNNTDFESPYSCSVVQANWSSSIFHQNQPESIGSPLFANNSCLPTGVNGFLQSQGCRLGGLPTYVLNATDECQVAQAMKWAADRNLRVVVKGTGHDLNGRSSGAFALSIWTRNFRQLERETSWKVPGKGNTTEDVIIAGSGHGWGDVLDFALAQGRVVTTGQDPSVGLGGYIQGGGHGPLASTYGLAAQQVLQARVITTQGEILVANEVENSDLFWAIRGGGAGLYGVVTEYVIRHFPAPESVMMGSVTLAPLNEQGANASWNAATILFNALPGLMDAGVAGAMSLASGSTGKAFNPSAPAYSTGAVVAKALWAYNMSQSHFDDLLKPVLSQMHDAGSDETITMSYSASQLENYTSFYSGISGSDTAGGGGVQSSHLLGHRHVDLPHDTLKAYLKRAVVSQNATAGTYMTVGMSGGPGVINTPESRFGAVLPAWKTAYLHLLVGGASATPSADVTPSAALSSAADWLEETKESLWREWAPDSGAYMNEGNPYNTAFKHDFYGANYDRLVQVKQKYDPTESLFVISGVGSDGWNYDLQSGKLCRVI